jgi:hypothetical protein
MYDFFIITTICGIAIMTLLIVGYSLKNGISPMPSSLASCSEFQKYIVDDSVVYDLGSGWGTVLFYLARKNKNIRLIGYESSPIPYLVSKCLNVFWGNRVTIRMKDIYSSDISNADTVLCYLYPEGMARLAETISDRLPKETVLISNTFALPGFEPKEVIQMNDLYLTKMYRYSIN